MIHFPEEIKSILNEQYNQQFKKGKRGIELPCTHKHKYQEPVYLEIDKPGDQLLICPLCGTRHLLTWSKIHDDIKFEKYE